MPAVVDYPIVMALLAEATDASLDAAFQAIAVEHGPSLSRMARGYEADTDRQRDLVQEILVAIWRALPAFEGRSSERTWALRIAHNVAVTHVVKGTRDRLSTCVSIEDLAEGRLPASDPAEQAEARDAVRRLAQLVRALRPGDRQIILLHLEGLGATEIAEVAGITPENAAVKVHRIKGALKTALAKEEMR